LVRQGKDGNGEGRVAIKIKMRGEKVSQKEPQFAPKSLRLADDIAKKRGGEDGKKLPVSPGKSKKKGEKELCKRREWRRFKKRGPLTRKGGKKKERREGVKECGGKIILLTG